MPRSNHPRRSRFRDEASADDRLEHALFGFPRLETKRDGLWNVQLLSGASSVKYYTCPGCGIEIPPGTAHTVAWRADGIMGEADDIAARRHWHSHCWRIK